MTSNKNIQGIFRPERFFNVHNRSRIFRPKLNFHTTFGQYLSSLGVWKCGKHFKIKKDNTLDGLSLNVTLMYEIMLKYSCNFLKF